MIWKHIDFANIKHEDWFDSLCVQYKDTKQKWTYVSHVSIIKKVLTSPHRKHAETNRFFRSSTDFIKHKKTIYNNRTAQFSTAQRLGLFQWCRISQKNPQTWNHTRSQQHLTTLLGVCRCLQSPPLTGRERSKVDLRSHQAISALTAACPF